MKQLLFISPLNISGDSLKSDGVMKKIMLQIETLKALGYKVEYIYWENENISLKRFSGKSIHISLLSGLIFKDMINVYKWLDSNIERIYDIIYIRHIGSSLSMFNFLWRYKKSNRICEVVAEIPTVMGIWEPDTPMIGKIKFCINKVLNILLSRPIDRFVTFSEDSKIYGRPTVCIENFVDVKNLPIRFFRPTNDFVMLGIAMITPSHGFDRVIRGLYDYYGNNPSIRVIFKIVGEGYEKEKLQKLTKFLGLEEYVLFEGKKTTDEIDKYIEEANIAVASLAIFRKRCTKASELKIREYCARGIPFIYSAYEPILNNIQSCFKQLHDESPINIKSVIQFVSNLDNAKATVELRELAEKKCTCEYQLKKVFK